MSTESLKFFDAFSYPDMGHRDSNSFYGFMNVCGYIPVIGLIEGIWRTKIAHQQIQEGKGNAFILGERVRGIIEVVCNLATFLVIKGNYLALCAPLLLLAVDIIVTLGKNIQNSMSLQRKWKNFKQ